MRRSRVFRAAACLSAAAFLFCSASCSGKNAEPTQESFTTQYAEQPSATDYDALFEDFAGPEGEFSETSLPVQTDTFLVITDAPSSSAVQPTDAVQATDPVSSTVPVQTTAPSTTMPTTTETTTAPHIHSYHTTVSPATCTERGYVLKSCECGDRKLEYNADALGHDFSEFAVSKEATPTETGEKVRVCSRCGLKENEVIPKIRPYESREAALEMLQLINDSRVQNGAQPLTFNETYYSCAEIRAKEIGENYSHTRPNGQPWYTVFAEQGSEYVGSYGENIFNPHGDSVPVSEGHTAFMNSAGHRKNILNPDYKSAAICVLYTEDRTYFVELFFG